MAGFTCVFALAVTGCATGSESSPYSPDYAPYVSATEAAATDSAGSPATYNLAFAGRRLGPCLLRRGLRQGTGRHLRRRPRAGRRLRRGTGRGRLLALLESANMYDVQVSTVNLMTMNYGESCTGDMGGYALTSAKAAHTQLKKVFGLTRVPGGAWRSPRCSRSPRRPATTHRPRTAGHGSSTTWTPRRSPSEPRSSGAFGERFSG
ncbi:hypothetical protein Scel_40530 [Streptomyces cellostaticus]|nr:hypothetical protein Scel_40530 [Streptomyces cellostaticus]